MALSIAVEELILNNEKNLLARKSDWTRIPLGSIAKITNGYAFKSKHFVKEVSQGLPLIRIRDIKSSTTQVNYVGDFSEEYIVNNGDILIGMDGDFDISLWKGEKALLNQRVCKVVVNSAKYNNRFFYYILPGYLDAIHSATSSVTVKHLSSRDIEKILLPNPSLIDQESLAEVIETQFTRLDAAIKSLKTIKAKLEIYRQSVLKAAFQGNLLYKEVDKEKVSLLDAEFQMPRTWKLGKLSDLGEFGRGKSKHRPRDDKSLYGGKYPFIQTGDVRNAKTRIVNYSDTYNEVGLKQSKLWPTGTLCITIAANIADTAILDFDACFPDSVVGFCAKDSTTSYYVMYFIQFLQKIIDSQASATAQKNINLAVLEALDIPVLEIDEQKAIVNEIESRFSVIDKLEQTITTALLKAERLRKSILKAAFEGKLADPEKIVD